MSVMNGHHHKAMDLAARRLHERMRGNHKGATKFFAEALDFELKALSELKAPIQPTHSVLHRSAATLGLDCGELRHAEKLAAKALAEEPARGNRGRITRCDAASTFPYKRPSRQPKASWLMNAKNMERKSKNHPERRTVFPSHSMGALHN